MMSIKFLKTSRQKHEHIYQSNTAIPSRASTASTVAVRGQEQWHAKMKTEKE